MATGAGLAPDDAHSGRPTGALRADPALVGSLEGNADELADYTAAATAAAGGGAAAHASIVGGDVRTPRPGIWRRLIDLARGAA